ncbi:MAG: hypothetical protein R3D59_10220 [Paracoccaceae bacterium]
MLVSGEPLLNFFTVASAPASADTLTLIGLDEFPQQCDLRLTRRLMSFDLDLEENLEAVSEVFAAAKSSASR